MNFSKYVYLDSNSPTGLRWAYEGGNGRGKHYIDEIAGVTQETQTYRIWLNGSFYKVHRIIYMMYHNTVLLPEDIIDHIDGNPFNNAINNLRKVTRKINSRNMKQNVNNKSGITGVSIDRKSDKHIYAVAQWRDLNSKHYCKSFSFLKYGEELAILMATEYRSKMIYLLNLIGGGYTHDHGKRC